MGDKTKRNETKRIASRIASHRRTTRPVSRRVMSRIKTKCHSCENENETNDPRFEWMTFHVMPHSDRVWNFNEFKVFWFPALYSKPRTHLFNEWNIHWHRRIEPGTLIHSTFKPITERVRDSYENRCRRNSSHLRRVILSRWIDGLASLRFIPYSPAEAHLATFLTACFTF